MKGSWVDGCQVTICEWTVSPVKHLLLLLLSRGPRGWVEAHSNCSLSLRQPLPDTEVAQTASFQTPCKQGTLCLLLCIQNCVILINENTGRGCLQILRPSVLVLRLMSVLGSRSRCSMPFNSALTCWLVSSRCDMLHSLGYTFQIKVMPGMVMHVCNPDAEQHLELRSAWATYKNYL